jgi:hypothetical protein
MSETVFYPSRSMQRQLEDLREEVESRKMACEAARAHIDYLQVQYNATRDELDEAREIGFVWQCMAVLMACMLVVVSYLA